MYTTEGRGDHISLLFKGGGRPGRTQKAPDYPPPPRGGGEPGSHLQWPELMGRLDWRTALPTIAFMEEGGGSGPQGRVKKNLGGWVSGPLRRGMRSLRCGSVANKLMSCFSQTLLLVRGGVR